MMRWTLPLRWSFDNDHLGTLMPFGARSIETQAESMRHRARELLAGQRTAALNALRGHLAEIGVA
jgi:hypothetical protein